jgi:hypothetical protein
VISLIDGRHDGSASDGIGAESVEEVVSELGFVRRATIGQVSGRGVGLFEDESLTLEVVPASMANCDFPGGDSTPKPAMSVSKETTLRVFM